MLGIRVLRDAYAGWRLQTDMRETQARGREMTTLNTAQ